MQDNTIFLPSNLVIVLSFHENISPGYSLAARVSMEKSHRQLGSPLKNLTGS